MLSGAFFATAFATILTPGQNMIYVATAGAQRGPAAGALAAAAVVLGGVCYSVTTAIGISAAMQAHPAVLTVIRALGVCYLVFLGVRLLIRASDTAPSPEAADARAVAFRGGLTIALTNPQLAMFFLSFLPQFVVPARGGVPMQLLELGLTFNSCSLIVMLTVAMTSGFAGRANVRNVRFRQVMRTVAGIAFLAIAIKSALSLLAAYHASGAHA